MQPYPDQYTWMRKVGSLLSIPLTLGLSPIVGCAIGWGLDHFLGTRPTFMLIGLLAGFAAGIRETWILIRRNTEDDEKSEESHSDRHN